MDSGERKVNNEGGNGNGGGGPGGLPKLKEIMRRQRQDSEEEDTPDVEFVYEDSDGLAGEVAEFYSYTENPEFAGTQRAFQDCLESFGLPTKWKELDPGQRDRAVQLMLDRTEVSSREQRLQAARAMLYVAQGCWLENQSDDECLRACKDNVMVLRANGVFATFVELLNLEME